MTDRLKKEEFVRLLASRMNADEATATAWLDGVVETLYDSFKAGKGVLPLSVVDNSAFSSNRLTVLSTLFILPYYKEASLLPISSDEDSYDASCVLAPTLVCPHVLSRAAVFPLLAPSWSCPVGSSNQAYPAPTPPQATLPTRLPRLSSLLRPLVSGGACASACPPLA
jgi:hypothetical protein